MLQSVDAPSERVYFVNENGVNKVLDRTPLAALLPANVTISAVLFELTPPALEYKRHTYVRTERCVYVQGKDDSAAQNQLAFDVSSNVRVFVNGLLLSPDAYDKTVQGTITFTPELNELSLLIEVFVYKSLTQFFTEDAAIRLDFSIMPQYDPLRIEGAWGDAQRASQYTPLYCVDTTALDRSRAYGLVRFEARDETDTLVAIDAQGYFLLASPPYAFQDKRLTAVVPVTALTAEGFSLSFAINGETGETNAVIDGETLQPLVRPLALTILDTIKTSREADKVGLIVTREEKTFIIGPA